MQVDYSHVDVEIGGIIVAIIGAVWYLGVKIGSINASVHELLTNHFPHLEARVQSIEEFIRGK